ncbi:uncharacterized protein LTR77_009832 [Saxophila tyrrhenica]|uniref:Chromo domain-containing protein n=1 Tax=Saxophila tyrrhenica TaxID=1690608 RepID=A0AAV9NYA6_9PEZI|nr:hypothetical protein LTR77_009832 [Saxophila tyrrhenica]
MAKRKLTTSVTKKKKSKQEPHPHGFVDPNKEYKIRSIIGETTNQYHISWEDDEQTGESFEDTWEPKKHANRLAIEDWENQKAQKRREQERAKSAAARSRAASAAQTATSSPPRPRKARSRKIIESSPPPPEPASQADDNQVQSTAEDLPEIGESQHTEPGAEQVATTADLGSPLFEPDDSPEAPVLPEQVFVAVQNPEPPSSFYEGAYQAVGSSQVNDPPSSPPRRSPEASQYVPDPVDTTGTTEGTTEISVAPTTQSELPQSAPANISAASVNVVPDSQAFHASSSYVPTTTTSKSSSAPQAQKVGSSGVPVPSAPTINSQENPASAEERRPEAAGDEPPPLINGGETGLSDQSARRQQTSSAVSNPAQHPRNVDTSAGGSSPVRLITDRPGALASRKEQVPSQNQINSQQSSAPSSAVQAEPRRSSAQAAGRTSLHRPSESAQPSQASHPAQHVGRQQYVDLLDTTQERSTLDSPFSVTAPPRRVPDEHQLGDRNAPGSSSWLESPFKTQVSLQLSEREIPAFHTDPQWSRPNTQPQYESGEPLTQYSTINSLPFSLPVDNSLLLHKSPLRQPPSQSIETGQFGDSVQPPPSLPSTPEHRSTMDNQSTPQSGRSLQEKIKAMREEKWKNAVKKKPSAAPVPAVQESVSNPQASARPTIAPASPIPARLASPMLLNGDGHRSPSAVPAYAPLAVITQEDMNTSERYGTLLPQAQESPSNDQQRRGSVIAERTPAKQRGDDIDPEKATLYTIPIGMFGHQRDQYPQTVWFHRHLVEKFLASSDQDEELMQEINHFVQRARNVAMHPDLDNAETLTQHDTEASQQAEWDIKCSAKLKFLKELIDRLRDQELHVVILSSPGRFVQMLETFLAGIGIDPHHAGAVDEDTLGSQGLRVTLLSTDQEMQNPPPAQLVIAMDNHARHDTATIRALRNRDGAWCPFISLVVPYTVEHVERCLSADLSERALARAVVNGVYKLRTEAGKLEGGQLSVKDSAAALAEYLTTTENAPEWPLVALGTLEDLDSQTESEIEPWTEQGVANNNKRPRPEDGSQDMEPANSKRARFGDVDITHVSDSIDRSTQSNALGQPAEIAQPAVTDTEKRLQDLLMTTQGRLDEHEQALSDLQYRHEDQRTHLVEVTKERDSAIATAQKAVERLNEQGAIRIKNKELEQQLREANERLLDHSVPERAEYEALRLAAADAVLEKQKVEKRLEQAERDLAYVRDLYQSSSNSAQQLASQNNELEDELGIAKTRASGEQVKLRQMGYDSYTKNLEKENKKLKALLTDREAGMKFRDEEIARLKEASRGRMGTRATSVPRSPRLGSPMKTNSRQGSPAAGEVRGRSSLLHPLRNA